MHSHVLVRAILVVGLVALALGCARGIVHEMGAVDTMEVTMPSSVDASVDVTQIVPAEAGTDVEADVEVPPARCEDTKTDEACFDCCDSKFPTGYDTWFDSFDACCPDDECTDDEWEKCELAADDACKKDPSCSAVETCEEVCWEKPSSAR